MSVDFSYITLEEIQREYLRTNVSNLELIMAGEDPYKEDAIPGPPPLFSDEELTMIQKMWDDGMGWIRISKQFGCSIWEIGRLFKKGILHETNRTALHYTAAERSLPVLLMYNEGYTIKEIKQEGYTSGVIQRTLNTTHKHLKVDVATRLKNKKARVRQLRTEALNLYFGKNNIVPDNA